VAGRRELASVFVAERLLGKVALADRIMEMLQGGPGPKPPQDWNALLDQLEAAHRDFAKTVAALSDEQLHQKVKFFVGPKTMGEVERHWLLWFLLHDQIHHRGQFSIYLRIADGKVPSIYGPSGDEPWM